MHSLMRETTSPPQLIDTAVNNIIHEKQLSETIIETYWNKKKLKEAKLNEIFYRSSTLAFDKWKQTNINLTWVETFAPVTSLKSSATHSAVIKPSFETAHNIHKFYIVLHKLEWKNISQVSKQKILTGKLNPNAALASEPARLAETQDIMILD